MGSAPAGMDTLRWSNSAQEPMMPALSIRMRLALTLMLVIGVGGVVQAAGYVLERSNITALQSRSAGLHELQHLAHELQVSISMQHDSVTAYVLSNRPELVARYRAARATEAALFGASSSIIAGFPEVAGELKALADSTDAWRTQSLEHTIALIQAGRVEEARSIANNDADTAAFQLVSAADAAFDAHVASLSDAALTDLQRIERDQATVFVISGVGALLGLSAAIWLLTRWIARPLGELLATARRVEAGEDVQFAARRDDEIGRLGMALERMRAGLYGQATEASVVNRFTELTTFVEADGDVARATLDALEELAAPDDGSIHISNRSNDRAVPEGSIGDVTPQRHLPRPAPELPRRPAQQPARDGRHRRAAERPLPDLPDRQRHPRLHPAARPRRGRRRRPPPLADRRTRSPSTSAAPSPGSPSMRPWRSRTAG